MIDGITYKKAVKGTRTKAQAVRAETQAKEDVYDGKYCKADISPKLADFTKEVYLPWSQKHKRSAYDDELITENIIIPYFGAKRLSEITPKLVRQFQRARLDAPARKGKEKTAPRQPATVNREMSVLSRIFSLAVEEELISDNPCLKVKQLALENEVINYLTQEEEARLLLHCVGDREHLRAIVLVDIHTGLRRRELFTLCKYQIDFNLNRIVVGRRVRGQETALTKTGKGRVIPMDSVVREELLNLMVGIGDLEYVFRYPATGQPIKSVKQAFAKACEKAKITGLRFHDLRHTFGTRLAEAGESVHRIAELMGHSNVQMTMRYVHAVAAGKHAAVERLVGYRENICTKFVSEAEEQALGPALSA